MKMINKHLVLLNAVFASGSHLGADDEGPANCTKKDTVKDISMMGKSLMLILCLGVFTAIPVFADVIVGLPADTSAGNTFPFGGAYTGEYQQVYTHSQFSGPIAINGLEFFNTQKVGYATALNSGTWTISLSTTSADWNTLSSTFASNIGANNTQVFLGNLAQPWAFGDTLILNFSTPFTYNPALGNLLMDVHVSGTSDSNQDVYLDTNGAALGALDGNIIMGSVYSGGTVNKGYGLVTDFTIGATAAPEPSFAFPLGVGLGLLGIANVLRLNRRAASDREVIA
jgi:hypothetical protein